MSEHERLLPMRAVRDQVALHPATVYAMIKTGDFPKCKRCERSMTKAKG